MTTHSTYGRSSISEVFPDRSGSVQVTREPDGTHVVKLRTPTGWTCTLISPDRNLVTHVKADTGDEAWARAQAAREV